MLWLVDAIAWGFVAWVTTLFFLAAGALTSVLDVSSARDRPLRPSAERRSITENAWSLIGGVVLAIIIGIGVDIAVRMFFDWHLEYWSLVVAAGLVVIAIFGALGILALMVRREGDSYDVLRANLAENVDRQLSAEQVAEFRAQLGRIDERHRRIRFGLRDRAGLRAIRARLDALAADLAAVPASGLAPVGRVRWKTANAYLWRANPWRLVPAVLAVATGAFAIALSAWWIVGLAALGAVLSFLFALLASRLALGAKVAQHAVNQVQRLDAVRLLEEREKSARRRTAGLGDRVTRALQILRDQQG